MKINSIVIICLLAWSMCQAGDNKTVIERIISIPADKIKENIINNNHNIDKDMKDKLRLLNYSIESEIDHLFSSVENNIDKYLDYHYSVIGEYKELYTSVTGDIEKDIQERLLGTEFYEKYKKSMGFLGRQYNQTLKQHVMTIDQFASKNIDMELNKNIFAPMMVNLKDNQHFVLHTGANIVGAGAGVAVGAKIASVIAAKAAAKAGAKATAKTTGKIVAKYAAKSAAAGTAATGGASVGVLCGVGAPVCVPLFSVGAALTAWFGTDAIVTSGDEFLTRDNFKKELMYSLNTMEKELKKSLKTTYAERFTKTSEEVRDVYKNTEVYERNKRIDSLFE